MRPEAITPQFLPGRRSFVAPAHGEVQLELRAPSTCCVVRSAACSSCRPAAASPALEANTPAPFSITLQWASLGKILVLQRSCSSSSLAGRHRHLAGQAACVRPRLCSGSAWPASAVCCGSVSAMLSPAEPVRRQQGPGALQRVTAGQPSHHQGHASGVPLHGPSGCGSPCAPSHLSCVLPAFCLMGCAAQNCSDSGSEIAWLLQIAGRHQQQAGQC